MFFFFCGPFFARAPRHWFREICLLSAPGVQSVFFFVALRWAPRPFGGARAKKKKHHPGCFFFAPAPCRRPTGLLLPLPFPGAGATKNTLGGVFFFALAPCRRPTGLLFRRGRSKKNTLGGVFLFAPAPCRRPTGLLLPLPFPGAGAKKNTLGGVFFFCSGPVPARGFSFPCLSPGPEQKKNTLGGVFFFCCGPVRTLTHSLRAWVAMPPPRRGGVFFLLRRRPGRAGVFFFAVAPPGRSLTHCGLGRFRQGPGGVFFFFLLRPRRVFLDNNKKCLGYYIGSKKTRRGHSKKKNTTSPQ